MHQDQGLRSLRNFLLSPHCVTDCLQASSDVHLEAGSSPRCDLGVIKPPPEMRGQLSQPCLLIDLPSISIFSHSLSDHAECRAQSKHAWKAASHDNLNDMRIDSLVQCKQKTLAVS